MNDQLRVRIEAIKRIHEVIVNDPDRFKNGKPHFHALKIADSIAAIDAAAAEQSGADAEKSAASAQKAINREVLRDMRSMMAKLARDLEFDHPGISAEFRFDKNQSDQQLIASSRAAYTNSAAYESDFIDATMPATFRDDLNTAIDNFEASITAKDSHLEDRVEATMDLGTAVQTGMRSKRALDNMAPNLYADDSGKLAAWTSASHVEKVPVKKPKTPTP